MGTMWIGLASAMTQVLLWSVILLRADVATALGIPPSGTEAVIMLGCVAFGVGSLAGAPLQKLLPRRARLVAVTMVAGGMLGIVGGVAGNAGALALAVAAAAAVIAAGRVSHEPMLFDADASRPTVRRAAFYRAASTLGIVAAAGWVDLAMTLGWTWRATLAGAGALTLALGGVLFKLREPRDSEPEPDEGGAEATAPKEELTDQLGRVLRIPVLRSLLNGYVVLGMATVPLILYLASRLEQRWGVSPHGSTTITVVLLLPGCAGLRAFLPRAERVMSRDPAGMLRIAAAAMAAGGVAVVAAGSMPNLYASLVATAVALALLLGAGTALDAVLFLVTPHHLTTHAAALRSVSRWAVGTVLGFALFASMDRRFGVGGALASLALPAAWAAAGLTQAAKRLGGDLEAMSAEVAGVERTDHERRLGTLPMLACQDVDFSYGKLQVLFGVNFTVSEGELVALLGTNGAGKSTLLRVISGLGLLQRGSVRFDGIDVSRWGAERRVGLGITQISGGAATFGPLSVVENLRLYGYTNGRSKRTVDEAVDVAFATFPQLASRRDQLAQTLSGGEQHMLGLTKALILRPRLLLVDELSLGLAPKVVGELLGLVREINGRGTAVVVVEQSVNVALSVAAHAYFMERGEIRFDGKAGELLDRRDLLRAVFLGNAAEGLREAR
jgi:ABC-type branched-subunit amino acid transport system ATPase component